MAAAAAQAAAIPGGRGIPDWCMYPIIWRSSSRALAYGTQDDSHEVSIKERLKDYLHQDVILGEQKCRDFG